MDLIESPLVDAFNRSEPGALINHVPNQIQEAMIECQRKEPALFGLDERDLFKTLRGANRSPSPTDNRIRLAFWLEHDNALSQGRDFNTSYVYAGVCSRQFFYLMYLTNPARVAWMTTPPVSYEIKLAEGLDYGLDRLREVLEMDNAPGGKPNIKLIEIQAKIVAMFDMRMKGGITQRTENKNLQLSISTTDKKVAQAALGNSMEALEARIKELDRRERASLNLPHTKRVEEPIDVESGVVER